MADFDKLVKPTLAFRNEGVFQEVFLSKFDNGRGFLAIGFSAPFVARPTGRTQAMTYKAGGGTQADRDVHSGEATENRAFMDRRNLT